MGTVDLPDRYPFELWSNVSPSPTIHEGETQAAFTERLHAACLERAQTLSNRAQRHETVQRLGRQEATNPSAPPLPSASSEADLLEKQALLRQLASQARENIVYPQDQSVFDLIDKTEGEAARTAFQKVLAPGNNFGLNAMDADKRELVFRYKAKQELQSQRRADHASRQLGLYLTLYATDRPRPAEAAW